MLAVLQMELQRLPGFRDFYPEDRAWLNYIVDCWRTTAANFGFAEYDGPTLESTDLYKKKSGEELKSQLFRFEDQGGRDVCLRPEMTPTLARLVAARERDFKKPIKWFSISPFFRFEKPQKGRLREFYQINCDLIGDNSPAADAELISLAIHLLRGFGLTERDFSVRLSNRNLWSEFLKRHDVPVDRTAEFLGVIDKLGREEESRLTEKLAALKLTLEQIHSFLATPTEQLPGFEELFREFRWRGIEDFCELDLTIVRGLDYYSGLVFELFDRGQENRAIGGGGRYDKLIEVISDGSVDLPAAGFAIGDVVLRNFLEELPHTRALAAERMAKRSLRGYIVIASELRRPEAIKLATRLREAGISVDFPLEAAKVAKQFQTAESLGAQYAVVVGQEWPQIRLKNLRTRGESLVLETELETNLKLEN
jgi:histidyl-tRNA synthetase